MIKGFVIDIKRQETILKFLFLVCFCMLSFNSFALETEEAETEKATESRQKVYSLYIPEEIEFADSIISLSRYDMRERFDRELLAFTYMHSTTFLLIKRANLYFPIIEPILRENGVPDDFKYLALIESYFNPRAVSPAGAGGIWQFMSGTGQMYGLEINDQVDERFNLEKATVAACEYLKNAYGLYGDWATAAASYNVGTNRLSQELDKQKVTTTFDLYLNAETSRYVFRILAAKEVLTNPQDYGFSIRKEHLYHTIRTKIVEINDSIQNWADWAKTYEITYAELKDFNLWIRDIKLDNPECKTYQIQIPYKEDLNFDFRKVNVHNKKWIN